MYKRILVPIAFDHEGEASEVLKLAQLLRASGGEIVLLNVIEPIPAYAEIYIPEDLRGSRREETEKFLDNIAKQVAEPVRTKMLVGNPGTQILEHAEDAGCDCIIMRSHKPGLEDYFLGSTAARVVRHAACSVHVVR